MDIHAFLPSRAMGLDLEYVGDLNYRVVDLISTIPDKLKLHQKFLNYIENKSVFLMFKCLKV